MKKENYILTGKKYFFTLDKLSFYNFPRFAREIKHSSSSREKSYTFYWLINDYVKFRYGFDISSCFQDYPKDDCASWLTDEGETIIM